ncbi:tyrosine-type recombinase/integrase [Porticoccaceae bacterium]|jgi:integrase|nr:tyrosine-type recombinase/integrase [Porticoccaceae bacterium]
MSRHFRYPKYTYLKDNNFYFSRSVPVDLRCFYTKPRIVQSLKTNSLLRAKTASKVFASKLDDYWLGLRLKSIEVPAAHLLVADGNASSLPTIEESLEVYFAVKGVGRPKLFFTTAQRYIGYLIECLGNRSIDQYTSKDATVLREWLINKGLSNSSLQRVFSGIKAVINFVTLEQGLECQNAFAKVYLPSNTDAKKRHAINPSNMAKIKAECLSLDDDIRWLVAIIFDTGMRLSEAAGLMVDDLKLEGALPYINLIPHPHRRLKTASSERKIPLVGLSLWAAKRLKQHSTGLYCFPRYTNPERCNSNSASATINKWIKTVGGSNDVIHGLRHSFRDRLRAVEAPTDMIDQLGGWALKSVGQGYGDGYDLELLVKYLRKLSNA